MDAFTREYHRFEDRNGKQMDAISVRLFGDVIVIQEATDYTTWPDQTNYPYEFETVKRF